MSRLKASSSAASFIQKPSFLSLLPIPFPPPATPTIVLRGTGADPIWRSSLSGSACSSLLMGLACLVHCLCLSPRFYSHWFGLAGPLLDGVPRLGGALLISRAISVGPRARNAVSPISTVMLNFLDRAVLSFSTSRWAKFTLLFLSSSSFCDCLG